jgi:hypothetical protein
VLPEVVTVTVVLIQFMVEETDVEGMLGVAELLTTATVAGVEMQVPLFTTRE